MIPISQYDRDSGATGIPWMSVAVLSPRFRAPFWCAVWHFGTDRCRSRRILFALQKKRSFGVHCFLCRIGRDCFSSTMFQFGLLSWPDCLALELAVSGIRVTPEHRMALFSYFARCLSSNDLHCDVILSQSRQFSQRWFVVYPCFWISYSILRSLRPMRFILSHLRPIRFLQTLCLLNGCSRFSNLLCLFRQILLTMCYFCLQLTLSLSVMTLFTSPHPSYILFQRPSSDHLVCYISWYYSWQLW